MGCPETLITDQGREFVNELSTALYAITNTEHRITSAYHPQVHDAVILLLLYYALLCLLSLYTHELMYFVCVYSSYRPTGSPSVSTKPSQGV